jgi:hypothetical protein
MPLAGGRRCLSVLALLTPMQTLRPRLPPAVLPWLARLADHLKPGRSRQILATRERVVHENDRLVHEISGETVWRRILIHISRQ